MSHKFRIYFLLQPQHQFITSWLEKPAQKIQWHIMMVYHDINEKMSCVYWKSGSQWLMTWYLIFLSQRLFTVFWTGYLVSWWFLYMSKAPSGVWERVRNILTLIKCEKGSGVWKGKEPSPPSQPWSHALHFNKGHIGRWGRIWSDSFKCHIPTGDSSMIPGCLSLNLFRFREHPCCFPVIQSIIAPTCDPLP